MSADTTEQKVIPFPAPTQPLELPGPRIWKAKDLAEYFGYSVSWVYKRTMAGAEDPIPRCNMAHLRFDTHSKAFQEWIRRQTGE